MSVNSLFKPNDYTIYVNANNLGQADLPVADQSYVNGTFVIYENAAGKIARRNTANGFSAASNADQIVALNTQSRITGPFTPAWDVGLRFAAGVYTAGPATGSYSVKATINIVSLTATAGDVITLQFGTNADITTPRLLSKTFVFPAGQTTTTMELSGVLQLTDATAYTFSIVSSVAHPLTILTGSILAGQANF